MSRKKGVKYLAAVALGMTMLFGTTDGTVNAAAPLHYFMQQPGNYESATPYGHNEKAGHYVQAGDAKIYYEVYGQGKPVLQIASELSGDCGVYPRSWSFGNWSLAADL